MVITRTVEMHAQLVGYDFKKKGLPTDKNIAVENSKVSNDYFWKTNKYTDQDVFGRTLDLTALINKPDGYLKGSLSDTEDVDYYEFNITEYRALSFAKDTYNKDITIILDHIPEGCDYEMVLYDEEGNQVGIGKENGNGGLSITIPNWNSDNRGYTVKVQAKNGSTVNPDAEYHLSFQTTQADKSHGAYQEMAEVQKYEGTVRKQMQEGLTDTEETRAIKEIRQKYKAYYTEQMEKLHQKQAEDVMQGGAVPDDEQIHNLLEKKAAGGELTEQENALLNIFCTAAELDRANASAKMNTTVKDRISADLQEAGIDISDSTFSIKIGADGQVSVDGIQDHAMKQKIENVLSKYSDELMDIYFCTDSKIQELSDKEKYLLQAAVDVGKFLYKASGGSVSLGDLSVENTAIHGLPKTLDDLLNNPGMALEDKRKKHPLPRYENGYSQTTIWAVRSMGIDPQTGREVFLTRDGQLTNLYSSSDQVPVGDTEPKFQGAVSTTFTYKGFSLTLAGQYRWGGQVFNQTLIDKVENANLRQNADRRALYSRWQKPGDQVLFKAIDGDIYKEDTKESSRFVMDDNEFAFTTINLSYRMEASRYDWLKRVGISSATIGFYMEDICRFSTVKMERGIEYPFSRQASMSLSVTF